MPSHVPFPISTFGPTFRAENSNTLAEFWMIEPKMAFSDLHDNMECAESYLKCVIQYVLERCPNDMAFFDQYVDQGIVDPIGSEFGLKKEAYSWYLDLPWYGSVPHSGFERLVQFYSIASSRDRASTLGSIGAISSPFSSFEKEFPWYGLVRKMGRDLDRHSSETLYQKEQVFPKRERFLNFVMI
ncbi:hypothetical protein ACTFIW_003731 [Dictyostelium discoideum]